MKLSKITDARGQITWCGTAKEVRDALTASSSPVTHESMEIPGASGVAKLLTRYEEALRSSKAPTE